MGDTADDEKQLSDAVARDIKQKTLEKYGEAYKAKSGKPLPKNAVDAIKTVLEADPELAKRAQDIVAKVSRHGARQTAADLLGAGVFISAAVNIFAAAVWENFRHHAVFTLLLLLVVGVAIYFRERLLAWARLNRRKAVAACVLLALVVLGYVTWSWRHQLILLLQRLLFDAGRPSIPPSSTSIPPSRDGGI